MAVQVFAGLPLLDEMKGCRVFDITKHVIARHPRSFPAGSIIERSVYIISVRFSMRAFMVIPTIIKEALLSGKIPSPVSCISALYTMNDNMIMYPNSVPGWRDVNCP